MLARYDGMARVERTRDVPADAERDEFLQHLKYRSDLIGAVILLAMLLAFAVTKL